MNLPAKGLVAIAVLNPIPFIIKLYLFRSLCDPFVSSCLDHFFRLCPQENISFSAGKMSEVLKKRANLDLIVLSDVYRLRGDTPLELASLFTSASKPFSPVHIFQKDPPARNDYVKADEWEGSMRLANYTMQVNTNIPLVASALEHLNHNQILGLSPAEIKSALSLEQNPAFTRKVPHRLIVANTPVNH